MRTQRLGRCPRTLHTDRVALSTGDAWLARTNTTYAVAIHLCAASGAQGAPLPVRVGHTIIPTDIRRAIPCVPATCYMRAVDPSAAAASATGEIVVAVAVAIGASRAFVILSWCCCDRRRIRRFGSFVPHAAGKHYCQTKNTYPGELHPADSTDDGRLVKFSGSLVPRVTAVHCRTPRFSSSRDRRDSTS